MTEADESAATDIDEPATEQDGPPRDQRPARRGPSRRTAAAVLTALICMVLLLWAIDWAAKRGAQSLLADQIQTATGTAGTPVVQIHGSLFLPQVIRGDYRDVEVNLSDVSSGPLRIKSVHADLMGVHLPFHDVLTRTVSRVIVERATEVAFLSYDDLNRYLSVTGHHVKIAPSEDGAVRLTGSVRVLGKSVTASADAHIASQDGALAVFPVGLHTETSLDKASRILLGQRFTLVIPLDPLPFGQQITGITAQNTGVVVNALGTNVVVTP